MFGGLAFLCNGRMFCGVVAERLMVRVGPDKYEEALARPHVSPMDFTGRAMKGYVFVEPAGCARNADVAEWVRRGVSAVSKLDSVTITLYAAGLGLMLYSPKATRALEDGRDYMPVGQLEEPLRTLVAEQDVVLLGTGSPQLDYELHVHQAPPPALLQKRAAAKVVFGMRIAGGQLLVRDGYDPMEWHRAGESLRRTAMPDGYYRVTALWLRDETRAAMIVHLYFQATTRRVPGDGWPYLGYRVR